tara:strand:- start:225 stop:872 length:648 start_codon:yes stop_codon:yes gene_type:complete
MPGGDDDDSRRGLKGAASERSKLLNQGTLVFIFDPKNEALTHGKFIGYADDTTVARVQKLQECGQRGLRPTEEYLEAADEFVKPMFSRVTTRLLRTHMNSDTASINAFAASMFLQYSSLQRLGFLIATERQKDGHLVFPRVATNVISPYKRNCLEAAFKYVLYERLQPQKPRLEDMSRTALIQLAEQLRNHVETLEKRVLALEDPFSDGSKRSRS